MTRKLCSHPGCPRLTAPGSSYCDRHGPPPDTRLPASQRGYDRDWRGVRDDYLASFPLCSECAQEGRPVLATEVHHILPLAKGGTHDWDNLQALCHSCHTKKRFLKTIPK
jgi:5-methylcytosine-specific restriction protein A